MLYTPGLALLLLALLALLNLSMGLVSLLVLGPTLVFAAVAEFRRWWR
jgi:hypothetical protein